MWRAENPNSMPWEQINQELHAEALQIGVKSKLESFEKPTKSDNRQHLCRATHSTIRKGASVSTTMLGSASEKTAPSHMCVASVMETTTRKSAQQQMTNQKAQPLVCNIQPNQMCQVNQKGNNLCRNILSNIITPINVKALNQWLEGYDTDKQRYLIEGFIFGFRIPYAGERKFRSSKNLKSAIENLDILEQKIAVEIKAGRVGGPFSLDNLPFTNLQISPLGLVPKQKLGEFRVIHHLSHPEGSSINDGIAKG